MAWPPNALPVSRTDQTPQLANHPLDHNDVNQAVNDIVDRMNDIIDDMTRASTQVTPNAGWSGSAYALRVSGLVTVVLSISRDAGDTTANGPIVLANVPTGFRPVFGSVYVPCTLSNIANQGASVGKAGILQIDGIGRVTLLTRLDTTGRVQASTCYAL